MLKQNLSRYIGQPPADLLEDEAAGIDMTAVPAAQTIEGQAPEYEASEEFKPDTLIGKLASRPRLVVGAALSLVIASATYASLAYLWYASEDVKAQENVALASVETGSLSGAAAGLEANTDHLLKAADAISAETGKIEMKESIFNEEMAQAPTAAESTDAKTSSASAEKPEHFSLLNLALASGGDPFSPLVKPVVEASASNAPPPKRDPLMDVQYTGYVGDLNARNKTALIKISDPVSGAERTLVKRIGESFTVDGDRITLKNISKHSISVGLNGASRTLSLNPYVDVSNIGATPAGATRPATNSMVNLPALPGGNASGGGNPANPALQEL